MRNICLLLLLPAIYSCSTTERFKTLSKRMNTCSGIPRHRFSYHNVRMLIYDSTQLRSMWKSKDTLYVLHTYAIDSGTFFTRIWSSHDSLSYTCQFKRLEKQNMRYLPPSQLFLVRTWDTATIRKCSEASHLIHSSTNYAYRLIPQPKNHRIDCITYTDFIIPEIDLINTKN